MSLQGVNGAAPGGYGFTRKRATRGEVGLTVAAYTASIGSTQIPVQRTAGWDGNASVEWVLIAGTALAGVDYQADGGSLFFASRAYDEENIDVSILPAATAGRTLTLAITVAGADSGITTATITIA